MYVFGVLLFLRRASLIVIITGLWSGPKSVNAVDDMFLLQFFTNIWYCTILCVCSVNCICSSLVGFFLLNSTNIFTSLWVIISKWLVAFLEVLSSCADGFSWDLLFDLCFLIISFKFAVAGLVICFHVFTVTFSAF